MHTSVFLYKKTILELSLILISPNGSNDLPHFALLIRLYVIKLSIIVLNEIPIFLNIFAASEAQRIFVSKNTVYKTYVPPVVHELTLWFGPIVPAVQKESLFPLGCVQTHSTYLPVTDLRGKSAGNDAPVDE